MARVKIDLDRKVCEKCPYRKCVLRRSSPLASRRAWIDVCMLSDELQRKTKVQNIKQLRKVPEYCTNKEAHTHAWIEKRTRRILGEHPD